MILMLSEKWPVFGCRWGRSEMLRVLVMPKYNIVWRWRPPQGCNNQQSYGVKVSDLAWQEVNNWYGLFTSPVSEENQNMYIKKKNSYGLCYSVQPNALQKANGSYFR